MRRSIQQVAELANVSAMTVSRVLRGNSALVRPETRERVLAAVRELEYIPVRYAAQNRHIQTNVIGLVPYYLNSAHIDIDGVTNEGIIRAAHANDYDLLIMLRDEQDWEDSIHHARFLDRRSDGFIFISICPDEWEDSLNALIKHSVIAVVCYRRDVPHGVAWVDPDNEGLVELAVDCLVRHGHRKIAYIAGPETLKNEQPRLPLVRAQRAYDDIEREHHFLEKVAVAGASVSGDVLHLVNSDSTVQPEIVDTIIERHITGVLCVSDLTAVRLMRLMRARGFDIPGDLSIIGTDGLAIAEENDLSTLSFGYDTVGELAVEAFLEIWSGKTAEESSRVVGVTLIERSTVGPPNRT